MFIIIIIFNRSIGVSNFTVEDLQEVLKVAKVKPAVNQVSWSLISLSQSFNRVLDTSPSI